MVTTGIDHIEEYRALFQGARVGLLTNPSGRDSRNRSAIDVLREFCNLTVLFGPEHGVRGDHGAGEDVAGGRDAATGLPVFSLYGAGGNHFSSEMLSYFDVLVYDIQDVGVRFYTYLTTLRNALLDCAKAGKRLVVLDRPDPLGGTVVEGGILDMSYESFVGCSPVPIRYGLTAGEAAGMMNAEGGIGCDLHVVPVRGWKRDSLFCDWGKVWLPPSLALMSFESVLLYPGICLIEGTNLSEGRGTAAPFRIVGADYVDAEELTEAFQGQGLAGVAATPLWFRPEASKHRGKTCGGVLLHVTDPGALRPVTVGITLLDLLRRLYPGRYEILPPYREGGKPMLALLSGGGDLCGTWDKDVLLARWKDESRTFARKKEKYHLYE